MVSTRRYGGIGAIGSGASRFFHPGERIRERYPAEAKGRVTGAAITGEGMRRVARKMQSTRKQTMPQLEFRRKLAQELLHNTLDVPQEVPQAVVAARRRTNTVHALTKRSREEGSWNPAQRRFRKVDTVYLKLKCHGCGKKIRTYCSCSPATPLCSVCFGTHINDLN